jgi:hypothetical protein
VLSLCEAGRRQPAPTRPCCAAQSARSTVSREPDQRAGAAALRQHASTEPSTRGAGPCLAWAGQPRLSTQARGGRRSWATTTPARQRRLAQPAARRLPPWPQAPGRRSTPRSNPQAPGREPTPCLRRLRERARRQARRPVQDRTAARRRGPAGVTVDRRSPAPPPSRAHRDGRKAARPRHRRSARSSRQGRPPKRSCPEPP